MLKLRKIVMCMMVVSSLCTMLFAGGKSELKKGNAPSQEAPTAKGEKETFTIGVKEDILVSDWKNNVTTKMIEDALGVNLEFVMFPSKEMSTKINLMAMDGGKDLPDIVFLSAKDADVYQWGQMGVILPLTKYYDDPKLSANIRESWTRIGTDYRGQITSPDGEIYIIPSYNQSYSNELPMKMWAYQPFLDKLGLKTPTTTDELENVLKHIVNDDPNGNGIKDEVGISGTAIGGNTAASPCGWFVALMNSFVYAGNSDYLTLSDDGKIGAAYTTDGWKEGLRYMARLMKEGLIQDAALTQNIQSFKAIANAENPQVFMYCWYTGVGMIDGSNPRRDDYVGVMPFQGPTGCKYVTYRPTTASARMMVTSNCKDPEKAFMVGDLLSSELYSIMTRWGQQHVDWDYIKDMGDASQYEGLYENAGFEKYIIVYNNDGFWSSGAPSNHGYRQQGPYVRQYGIYNGSAQPKGSFGKGDLNLAETNYKLRKDGYTDLCDPITKLIYNSEENEVASEIKATLDSYVNEYASAVIAGQKDLDATWADFQKEIKAIGVEEYLKVTQGVYDRMYGSKK